MQEVDHWEKLQDIKGLLERFTRRLWKRFCSRIGRLEDGRREAKGRSRLVTLFVKTKFLAKGKTFLLNLVLA